MHNNPVDPHAPTEQLQINRQPVLGQPTPSDPPSVRIERVRDAMWQNIVAMFLLTWVWYQERFEVEWWAVGMAVILGLVNMPRLFASFGRDVGVFALIPKALAKLVLATAAGHGHGGS